MFISQEGIGKFRTLKGSRSLKGHKTIFFHKKTKTSFTLSLAFSHEGAVGFSRGYKTCASTTDRMEQQVREPS